MAKQYYVYLMTNRSNSVIYTGITNNLERRVSEHKTGSAPGFTKRFNLGKLVYYEIFEDVNYAIEREKQIKGGSRTKKVQLIMKKNPGWLDLSISV